MKNPESPLRFNLQIESVKTNNVEISNFKVEFDYKPLNDESQHYALTLISSFLDILRDREKRYEKMDLLRFKKNSTL